METFTVKELERLNNNGINLVGKTFKVCDVSNATRHDYTPPLGAIVKILSSKNTSTYLRFEVNSKLAGCFNDYVILKVIPNTLDIERIYDEQV